MGREELWFYWAWVVEELTDYEVVLELMNGTWTLLLIQIVAALAYYVYRRAVKSPIEPQWVWVDAEKWYHELGTQLAVSWMTYAIGSATARGWAYVYRECANRLGDPSINCIHVTDDVYWLFIASVFAIVGGVCTIRVMLPFRWGWPRYVIPFFVSVIPPCAWHLWVNWPITPDNVRP